MYCISKQLQEMVLGHIYCMKCKAKTANVDPAPTQLKNGRMAITCKCGKCGTKKFKASSPEEIQRLQKGGFLGALIGPLISGLAGPLLGGLFGQKGSGRGKKKA